MTGGADGWAERINGGVAGSVLGCVVYKIPRLSIQVRDTHRVYGILAREGLFFGILEVWM